MAIITSPTLLKQMKNVTDNQSWDRFYQIYSPLVIGFCRKRSISNEIALDVLQETMVCLLRLIPNFDYDPANGKFSALLLKIVDCRIKDAIRRQKRYCTLQSNSNANWVEEIEDSKISMPCKEWDDLWEKNMLLQGLDRVKERVDPITFDSFRLYVLEKKSIDDVCKFLFDKYQTKFNRNSIYQHKTRVIKLLKRIMQKLEEETGR